MNLFRILYRSEHFVAVDKPAGVHVHPPEDERHRIPKNENGLAIIRDQLGQYVYPVHRLDRATSGVLIYALSSEAASRLGGLFAHRRIEKTYYALVRGHSPARMHITSPLSEAGKEPVEARTDIDTLASVVLPWRNGAFEVSRYSLVRARPETGRFHQIRRHLKRITHPIVGDSVHGEGVHNRLWCEEVGRKFLFLKCYSLAFENPFDGERTEIASYWNPEWLRAFERFGVCPHERISPPKILKAPV